MTPEFKAECDAACRRLCRSIAISVLQAMQYRDVTTSELAEKMGVSASRVRRLLVGLQDGRERGVRLSTIALIAHALDCEIDVRTSARKSPAPSGLVEDEPERAVEELETA